MTITKDLAIGSVYTFKLTSGEELVGKVEDVNISTVFVSEPVSVAPGPNGLGLVPSLFTAEPKQNVSININSITMIAPTESGVKSKYTQATSNIVMPEKKIIMG